MTVANPEELSATETAEVCRRRESMYALIASLFLKEPTRELLTELRSKKYPINTGNAHIDQGNRLLATYLNNVWENSQLELAVEYVRTFIGYGVDGDSAAYPYESTYTSERHLLMQGARDEVRAIFKSMGLHKVEEYKDEEDHIGVELSFMSVMCARCAAAAEAEDTELMDKLLTVQYNFLSEHLGHWAPTFACAMRKYAQSDFYLGASYLLEGFMELEAELFAIDFSSDQAESQE